MVLMATLFTGCGEEKILKDPDVYLENNLLMDKSTRKPASGKIEIYAEEVFQIYGTPTPDSNLIGELKNGIWTGDFTVIGFDNVTLVKGSHHPNGRYNKIEWMDGW